ncbi:MAG: MCE family protein [Gemmatimonadetes bacterium]|nr:MCE family protein [Gemmatimonadota bacterium]
MKFEQKQEVTVGFLVIVAVVVFAGGFAWLSGRPLFGGRQVTVSVRFSDVRGLSEGDPVLTSGLQVGRVASVELEDVGMVKVVLLLDTDDWRPGIDASASVKSFDFLGTKFVDYNPGVSDQLLTADQIIPGTREVDALDGASGLADQAAAVLTGVQAFVDESVLSELMATLQATRSALETLTEIGQGRIVDEASAAMATMANAAERVDSLLANPALERSVNQLDEVTTSLREMADGLAGTTEALSRILEGVERGEGSLGMALRDTALYHNTNEMLLALTRLLDDMRERPGRYFHLKVF